MGLKLQYRNVFLGFAILLMVVGSIPVHVDAQELQSSFPITANKNSIDASKVTKETSDLEARILEIQEVLSSREENTEVQIKELESLIATQRDMISNLRIDLKSMVEQPLTNGTTFEVWSSVLLACVAVIVTVLGVAIAIISFIGGKVIIASSRQISEKTATDEAQKVATNIANEAKTVALNEAKNVATEISLAVSAEQAQKVALDVANKITPEAAEKKLRELLDQGSFNDIILEAVDKIALSNMVDPENYKEGNPDEPL